MSTLDQAISASAIALAVGYDEARVAKLKDGDGDPLEVAVRITPGPGGAGYYEPTALQQLVRHVAENTLAGYRGHLKPEELPFRFLTPATHWVGAEWRGNAAYVRGVVDRSDPDLKRLIRTGASPSRRS